MPRVRSFSPRVRLKRSRASLTQASLACSASSWRRSGAISPSRISRLDSAPSCARRLGQPTPPPTASMTAKSRLAFSVKRRRISSACSGLAFKHSDWKLSPSPSGNIPPQAAKGENGSTCLCSSSSGAFAGTYTSRPCSSPRPRPWRARMACSRLSMLLSVASTTTVMSLVRPWQSWR